jgi:hypothetical protein
MPSACVLALCLHLIDLSSASPATLVDARHQLDATYESIGVPVRWTDAAGAILLIVRDDEPGTLRRASQPILGVSIHGAQGSPAAYVFYRRAAEQADRYRVPRSVVVAAAMAHEVGHLLLPSTRHADRGLMRAWWNAEEFVSAAQGDLRFSSEEGASIRANLRRLTENEFR